MKIISWNVAGIKARANEIERLMQEHQPDIVCLQKTRSDKAPDFDGYRVYVDCVDRWSGVAAYVRSNFKGKFIESDSHHLILNFDEFVLVNAYVPYSNPKVPGYVERRKVWDRWIVEFAKKQTKPVIICGDLNIVPSDLDSFYPSCVRNTGCYYQWERDDFNRLLSECKLVDTFRRLHPEERGFTYFDTMHGVDYRATDQGSRLDYFLVSESLMPYVMKSEILSPLSAPSNPIMLDIDKLNALKFQNEVSDKTKPHNGVSRILFLHGFTSSGSCEIATMLREELEGVAEVVAPDIALRPYEAMAQLLELCDAERFDLIVGSSCGAFYGQQLVRFTGLPAVLISPFFMMTEFLEPRLGWHEYKSSRTDGNQRYEITPELVEEFAKMQAKQFDCYDEYSRGRVVGMFGSKDTLAHFMDLFTKYYYRIIDYDGPHTMTADNVRNDLIPVVKSMLEEFPQVEVRYFRHFKGNSYRLVHTAKDSETMERMVVYQALYESHGYWVRPEKMFFERIERNGQEIPRFAEISNINVK